MGSIRPLTASPLNLDVFVEEMAQGMTDLYGPEAGEDYRGHAGQRLAQTISHPSVVGFGYYEGKTALAIAIAVLRGDYAHVMMLHELTQAKATHVDGPLMAHLVDDLRGRGLTGILCEFVPLYEPTFGQALLDKGFRAQDRAVLVAPAEALAISTGESPDSEVLAETDDHAAAAVLVSAWAGKSGRDLHPEVYTVEAAFEFLSVVRRGGYGAVQPGYMRSSIGDSGICGVLAGACLSPRTGFVLHVAVDPAHQRQHRGEELIRSAAREFVAHGLSEVALGVTWDNPARHLYERMGFRLRRHITAYVWWSQATHPQPSPANP